MKPAIIRYGVRRWSPPGRVRKEQPAPKVRPICDRCLQPGVNSTDYGCINALSSPEQRKGWAPW